MADLFVSVNGLSARHLHLHVPPFGAPMATVELEDEARDLSVRVELQTGDLVWKMAVAPEFSGTHALGKKLRLKGGNGNWGALLPQKAYPNDAGVKSLTVAQDLASACGEVLATDADFSPAQAALGPNWTRRAGPAGRSLDDCTGGVGWWVGADGRTYVRPRVYAPAPAGSYEVLEFNPATRLALLNVESLLAVGAGSVLTSDRLDGPQAIQSFDLVVTQRTARMYATCGTTPRSTAQLEELFKGLVRAANPTPLFGKWRYRVKRMAGERVELQIVKKATGLPDNLPIRQWPGVPGMRAKLRNGSIVTVEFLEGDLSLPRVTGYAGEEDPEYAAEVILGGKKNVQEVACKGDTVTIPLAPCMFSGTIGGAPATGILSWPTGRTIGTISTGTNLTKSGRG